LSDRPYFSDCPCQFDVALVSCQRRKAADDTSENPSRSPIRQRELIQNYMEEYQLTLDNYISGAFE
jgi:putative endonuclease